MPKYLFYQISPLPDFTLLQLIQLCQTFKLLMQFYPLLDIFSESMSVHILLVPFFPYTSVLQQDFNYLKISEFLAHYEINVPSYNCDPF